MEPDLALARDALDAHPSPTLLISARGELLHANAAARDALGPSLRAFLGDEATRRLCSAAVSEQRTARAVIDAGPGRWDVAVAPLERPADVAARDGAGMMEAAGEEPGTACARSEREAPVVVTLSAAPPRIDLEALAAGLAHEIRNPLAGLQGAAELMIADLPGRSPHRAHAELIAKEARRVDGLVRALLDLTRPPALRPAPCNVHEVCEHVIGLVTIGDGLRLERRYDPSLPELAIDRDAIVQVLLNLAKNALQSMEGRRGTIAIETAIATGMKVRSGGRSRGLARISILDEGPGLPEDLELFTPFVTSRRGGTGLGLVIARRLVEAHGGRLELRDRREGGAEALVLLPIA